MRTTSRTVDNFIAEVAPKMATDQALKNTDAARSGRAAHFARAVTHPGGMDIDWSKVRAGSAAVAGLALLHGVRHRRWRYIHIAAVLVGVAAATATVLQKNAASAAQPSDKN